MIPTWRLYLILLLGMAIALFLDTFFDRQISLTITFLFDIVVLGLAVWDGWRTKPNRVEISRIPLHRLSIGRDNPVVFNIQSGDRAATLQIRDGYPPEMKVSGTQLQTTIPSDRTAELSYAVYPSRRGEFQWGDIQARQQSLWGLVWTDWTIPAKETVAVYPDLVGLRSLSIRLSLENTGTMRRRRRWGMGTEFSELRDYGMGDDTRLIDWKATARHSRPLVRVLEPETEQTLIILLDRGRLMTAQVRGLKRFDWGLNATLSLALAGLNRGDRVGVGVFDRDVTTWIPPERGQHQLSKLLERLTPIQPVLLEPDYGGAVNKLVTQQTRRALVVVLTDIVDTTASAELLSGLSRLAPRYLPFCVTLRDPQVDRLSEPSETQENRAIAAYTRAVALDLLHQRQLAFSQLKQKGVLVLDAPANQISEPLVDRYLQLKARNLL